MSEILTCMKFKLLRVQISDIVCNPNCLETVGECLKSILVRISDTRCSLYPNGAYINDVTQPGGRGVETFVTLCMKAKIKQTICCDRKGRGVRKSLNLRDIINEWPLSSSTKLSFSPDHISTPHGVWLKLTFLCHRFRHTFSDVFVKTMTSGRHNVFPFCRNFIFSQTRQMH